MSEPVTLGNLRVATANLETFQSDLRQATLADLVSALRAEGAIVILPNVRRNWPADIKQIIHEWFVGPKGEHPANDLLDALAEAQPE